MNTLQFIISGSIAGLAILVASLTFINLYVESRIKQRENQELKLRHDKIIASIWNNSFQTKASDVNITLVIASDLLMPQIDLEGWEVEIRFYDEHSITGSSNFISQPRLEKSLFTLLATSVTSSHRTGGFDNSSKWFNTYQQILFFTNFVGEIPEEYRTLNKLNGLKMEVYITPPSLPGNLVNIDSKNLTGNIGTVNLSPYGKTKSDIGLLKNEAVYEIVEHEPDAHVNFYGKVSGYPGYDPEILFHDNLRSPSSDDPRMLGHVTNLWKVSSPDLEKILELDAFRSSYIVNVLPLGVQATISINDIEVERQYGAVIRGVDDFVDGIDFLRVALPMMTIQEDQFPSIDSK